MYYVIDTETSIKNRGDEAIGKFKASPFHPDNKVVMFGFTAEDTDEIFIYESVPDSPSKCDLLVGHNIGFDLLHLYRSEHGDYWRQWVTDGGKIWDTMIVEYIITGQESQFASLDKVSEKYGGTLKDDRIKEYWNANIDTEDIPKEELEEYLIHDVENTEKVFLAQLEKVYKLDMIDLVHSQMEARLATIEMEWNGMYFDREAADTARGDLGLAYLVNLSRAISIMSASNPDFYWSPTSNQHVGTWLFGGELKYDGTETVTEEDGTPVVYKTGKKKGLIKTRKCKKTYVCDSKITGDKYSVKGKNGWSVDESTLRSVLKDHPHGQIGELCTLLLDIRVTAKDISTYYDGYINLTWPTDSCIHPSFNHTATATGRLSCSNPNLQQVTSK